MSSMQQVLTARPPVSVKGPRRPPQRRRLHGSDLIWAIAFTLPYAAVFLVFVVYPFGYALWMARKPSLYADLIAQDTHPAGQAGGPQAAVVRFTRRAPPSVIHSIPRKPLNFSSELP